MSNACRPDHINKVPQYDPCSSTGDTGTAWQGSFVGAPLLPGPPQAQVKIKHQLCAYASSLLVGAVCPARLCRRCPSKGAMQESELQDPPWHAARSGAPCESPEASSNHVLGLAGSLTVETSPSSPHGKTHGSTVAQLSGWSLSMWQAPSRTRQRRPSPARQQSFSWRAAALCQSVALTT